MKRGNPHTIKGKGFDARPENINKQGRPKKIPALDDLLKNISEEHYQAIIDKLSAKARSGDVRAAEVVLDRAYGKPNQKVQIDLPEDQLFVIGGKQIKF